VYLVDNEDGHPWRAVAEGEGWVGTVALTPRLYLPRFLAMVRPHPAGRRLVTMADVADARLFEAEGRQHVPVPLFAVYPAADLGSDEAAWREAVRLGDALEDALYPILVDGLPAPAAGAEQRAREDFARLLTLYPDAPEGFRAGFERFWMRGRLYAAAAAVPLPEDENEYREDEGRREPPRARTIAEAARRAGADAVAARLRAELQPAGGELVAADELVLAALQDYVAAKLYAALPYSEGVRPRKPRRVCPPAPSAVGTYPELAVIGFAAADAKIGANWVEAPGGGVLVHQRKKAGLQVRYAPPAAAGRWAEPEPGALSTDLFDVLAANGGLDTVFLAQVGAHLSLANEHEDVSLDELGRMIGRNPRSTREREDMRRDLWGRLKFLDGFTVWGARRGTYRDPVTRKQIPLESRDPLFTISGTMWPEQGTLDGSEAPLQVSFGAGPFLAQFRGRPDVLTSYGDYRRLAAIPGEKVGGAWARTIGLAVTQRQRERASYGGVRVFTVGYLLTQWPPTPTVDAVLSGPNPARARKYFAEAFALLKRAGTVAAYTLPDESKLPRTGWAPVWLAAKVSVTPPPAVLNAAEQLQARRAEEEDKASTAAKRTRRPRRVQP
jgi:hypothetical protein